MNEGLIAAARQRTIDAVADRSKARLTELLAGAVHRSVSRKLIIKLTRELTVSVFKATAAKASGRVVKAVMMDVAKKLPPVLSKSLSHSIVHAVSHHPAAELFCTYCYTTANMTAAAHGDGLQGSYCSACERALAHDRQVDHDIAIRMIRFDDTFHKSIERRVRTVLNGVLGREASNGK